MRVPSLFAAVAVLLVGCSSTVPATPTASPLPSVVSIPTPDVATLDPCSLLDAAEVSDLLEVSLLPVPAAAIDGYRVCAYSDPGASTNLTVLVRVNAVPNGGGEERVGQLPQDGRAEELHGVGEAAWFDFCPACPDEGSTTLTVIEPPLEFNLALVMPAPDAVRRIPLEEMARGVIDRLGL